MAKTTNPRVLIKSQIDKLAEQFRLEVKTSPYVIYMILDPTQPDPKGQHQGLPIYVGVSSQIHHRLKQHFRAAGASEPGNRALYQLLGRLLQQQILVKFEIVERLDNKRDAMIAETVHAQRLLAAGYRLMNSWYFQRNLLSELEMAKVVARIHAAADSERDGWK